MDIIIRLLEVLLTWPVAVLIICLTFFIKFKDAISTFLKKLENNKKSKQELWSLWASGLLILASVVVAAVFAVIASKRTLTQLESIMLQTFSLSAGLIGSFIFGKQSAKQAAKELIKPHARSSFRRLVFLYQSLSRLAIAIEKGKKNNNSDKKEGVVLDKIEAIVVEQIATADDALEDWRDIVPEDVEELYNKLKSEK